MSMSDPFNYLSRATHTAKVQSSYGPLAYFSYIFISGKNVVFSVTHLNTIGGRWYFWKGIWASKAHKPGTLSGNATFTKV